MTTTIKVSHDVSEETLASIELMAEREALHNPAFAGGINVERDEFTCVDCENEYSGAELLSKVNRIVDEGLGYVEQ